MVLFQILLISASGLLHSCGPSRMVQLRVTRPAALTFPSEVKNLVLLDRTKPTSQTLNILEGIVTGEMPSEDRIGAQEAVNSLKNELLASPRFTTKVHPVRLTGNSLSAAFPQALDWPQVQQICSAENADVLVSFEIFDSDFVVTNGSRIQTRAEGSKSVSFTEYYAQGLGNLKLGIRTYYPKTNTILDQQIFNSTRTWEGVGSNPAAAAALLISKVEANRQLAKMVAADYAYKISPMPVVVNRYLYGKSGDAPALEAGRRYADVGQWKEAIDTWKTGLPAASPRDAGKLAFNIAIGFEVLGDFDFALEWARDAYTRYGNSQGMDYVRVIEQRIQDEILVKQQLQK